MQDHIKSTQSQISMPHVIKVHNDKNTPYSQLKKQQLGKQSRKLQPWFIGLLELPQQKNDVPKHVNACINPMVSNWMHTLLTCFMSQGCQGGEQDCVGVPTL